MPKAFRENEMPVFLVHFAFSKQTALQPIADLVMPLRGEMPADWAEIVPELGPAPSDVVIAKRQWGAFMGLIQTPAPSGTGHNCAFRYSDNLWS